MWMHLTARAYDTPVELHDIVVGRWLWQRLSRTFPRALAASLMPNHLHLVVWETSLTAGRRRLGAVISGLRRSNLPGAMIQWEPVASGREIRHLEKLRIDVRYVVLNPNRARLVADPLCWLWSTHRDAMGAVTRPWVSSHDLANAFQWHVRSFRRRFHDFVSTDRSADVAGTPAPQAASCSPVPAQPIADLVAAAAAATRLPVEAIRRRSTMRKLFLQLTREHGWNDVRLLSRLCNVTPEAVRQLRQPCPHLDLGAAQLCLGDGRLRVPFARQAERLVESSFRQPANLDARSGARRLHARGRDH